ncbi:hypothetical protein [Flavobacterium salmonis]|uniref:Uncharacterized protein n=1 Tax=Flavobacterium salmonis TaxID=2654844 RepID=A0A6V6ZBZ2_9FLAO|nr:hypothetical protein [Flavobacterium salmonis]CAD0009327.1 hypothetical protein FLAT13_04848 [Flavobacterium salmonis]
MKNKIHLLFLLAIFISCSRTKTIEEVLIAKPNDYWIYYSPYSGGYTYYKFGEDKISQRYERDSKNKFYKYEGEGDVMETPQKWSVSQDSILRFKGFVYDVVSYNEEVVVLYYKIEDNKEGNFVFLTKEKTNKPINYPGFYLDRRVNHPEKYKVPYSWWISK